MRGGVVFFFKQKTAYRKRISDWSSDVCSSDLRAGAGYDALAGVTMSMIMSAQQVPEVTQVFSLFNTGSPRLEADVDRDRAQLLGVQPAQIFEALGTYLGSTYVNDFNLFGRTFRVKAQAEPTSRNDRADIGRLQVRSASDRKSTRLNSSH